MSKPNQKPPQNTGPVLSSKALLNLELEQDGVNQAKNVKDTESEEFKVDRLLFSWPWGNS